MKKLFVVGILAVFMTLGLIYSTGAADATVAMDLNSAYVWRGITFNDGAVSASLTASNRQQMELKNGAQFSAPFF